MDSIGECKLRSPLAGRLQAGMWGSCTVQSHHGHQRYLAEEPRRSRRLAFWYTGNQPLPIRSLAEAQVFETQRFRPSLSSEITDENDYGSLHPGRVATHRPSGVAVGGPSCSPKGALEPLKRRGRAVRRELRQAPSKQHCTSSWYDTYSQFQQALSV